MRSQKAIVVLLIFALLNIAPWIYMQPKHRSTFISTPLPLSAATQNADEQERVVQTHSYNNGNKGRSSSHLHVFPECSGRQMEEGSCHFPSVQPLEVHEGRTVTGPELLKNYNPKRMHRVCLPLAHNITINLEPDFKLGVLNEVRMPEWRKKEIEAMYPPVKNDEQMSKEKKAGDNDDMDFHESDVIKSTKVDDAATQSSIQPGSFAYVLMVSNHKYVDGALVMGDSIRQTSAMVRNKECDLIILISDKLKNDAMVQLSMVFDRVKVIHTVGYFTPQSYYKTTFDKMYLFFMTEYKRVLFLDADHLMSKAKNIDALFLRPEVTQPNELVAVGGMDYFQTALLVVTPNMDIFTDIYLELRYGAFGYNQWRARDGILLRNCFLSKGKVMGVGHPQGLHHYYGYVKPWFDHSKPHKHRPKGETIMFDSPFRKWWDRYEALHEQILWRIPLVEPYAAAVSQKYGMKNPQRIDRRSWMWVQRFSGGSEYMRATTKKSEQMRNHSIDHLVGVISERGESCDVACARLQADDMASDSHNFHCDESALRYTALTSCKVITESVNRLLAAADKVSNSPTMAKKFKGCSSCKNDQDDAARPVFREDGGMCLLNPLWNKKAPPLCNATGMEGMKSHRICPCAPGAQRSSR